MYLLRIIGLQPIKTNILQVSPVKLLIVITNRWLSNEISPIDWNTFKTK